MDTKVKTKNLRQSVIFSASLKEVYELIIDSKKHSSFSGASAKISREIGGKFTVFGGWATGKNVKIVPNRLIVQTWRAEDWPKCHYSVVTFKFTARGRETKLEFTQSGIPAEKYKDIAEGWKEYYWERMKSYLEAGPLVS